MMIPAATQIPGRPAAIATAGAAALTLVMLAHHPLAAHREGDELLRDLVQQADASALVHTTIIGLVCLLLYGVIALALDLGLRRPAIAFGLAAYGFGCTALTGAMLLDGFATATLARWLSVHPQPANGMAELVLVAIGIQVLTKAGLAGMAIGMACLSWARWRTTRLLAVLALPGALLPLLLATFGGVQMAPHSLIALTGLQALWYAGAAWRLWRAPFKH